MQYIAISVACRRVKYKLLGYTRTFSRAEQAFWNGEAVAVSLANRSMLARRATGCRVCCRRRTLSAVVIDERTLMRLPNRDL